MRIAILSMTVFLTAAVSARAQVLDIPLMDEEEGEDLKKARQKLRDLERRIKRKDIPPIEFEFNKAVLRPYSKHTLEMVADLLFEFPHFKLMVFGHTCDIGSDEYNLWLSQKRAEAVKNYLIEVGVMGEFIKAKGFGEKKPVVPNDSEESREQNRRVEFVITKRWWESVF
jgi:outer membrane protein OmpA-like peptidoglycan-associated protein